MQGCPDLGDRRDGLTIWVGGCGTAEKRYPFDRCPGWYLRRADEGHATYPTVDGIRTSFDLAWPAHFAFTAGHSIGHPPPPKLYEAVLLFEAETRARQALILQRQREEAERARRKSTSGKRVIAKGR